MTVPHKPQNAITVIIPTFNRRKWLQNAVESVLRESRVPILLRIFDNASTDDTEDFVKQAAAQDSRLIYKRNSRNIGVEANYARAFESVDTEYFVPLADDDWLLPNFLFDAFEVLEANTQAGAAIFITEARAANGKLINTYPTVLDKIKFGLLKPDDHLRDWMSYGHYAWSSILWRAEVLGCVGAPYLHVGLPSDVDFQLQIFCRYPVYLVNRPGAVYFVHENQSSRRFDLSHLQSWTLLFKRMDRTIRKLEIFGLDEYLYLRKFMQHRYRGAWSRPPTIPLSDRQLHAAACSAGFRLGDWDLAFSLLDQSSRGKSTSTSNTPVDSQIFLLPQVNDDKPEDFIGEFNELLPSIVAWFKVSKNTIKLLSAEVIQLKEEKSSLEIDVDQKIHSEEHLKVHADRWRLECEETKTQLSAIKRQRLVRLLGKLRLVRF